MAKALSRICFFMMLEIAAFHRVLARQIVGAVPTSGRRHISIRWRNSKRLPDKTDMTRADAIARARQHLHSGGFLAELDRRVAYPTESQNSERREALRAYLEQELQPAFSQLDFATRLIESPTGKTPIFSPTTVRVHRRRPSSYTVTAMLSTAWWESGGTISTRGGRRYR